MGLICQSVIHIKVEIFSVKILMCCCNCALTWPSACGAQAYAADPQLRWHAGLAAAYLARNAACAGRHRSEEVQNKYQQVKTQSLRQICVLDLKSHMGFTWTVLC